jgi:hypothetical protein
MKQPERRFKIGDRIRKIGTVHYAGPTDHDYGDRECREGDTGHVQDYYHPDTYDDSKMSRKGLVVSVQWDKGNSSAINEDLLDHEIPAVTPAEEAAAIESILKGVNHG